jgi:hypothetical protein
MFMHCTATIADDSLQLTSMPSDHDGVPPVPVVRVSLRPRWTTRDRRALAMALLYKPWIADRFTPNDGCTPMVARAISRLLAPRDVVVDNVTHKNEAIPVGSRSALISDETPATLACSALVEHDVVVRLSNDQTNNSTASMHQLSFVSNVKHLMGHIQRVEPTVMLGLTLFYAQDYDIRRIVLPISVANRRRDLDLDALVLACRSVNIELYMPLLHRSEPEILALAGDKRGVLRFCSEFRSDRRAIGDYPEIAALGLAGGKA